MRDHQPQQVMIHNLTRPGADPLRADYCVSFICRLRGLMFRRSLAPDYGLLLVQPKQTRIDAAIHMLFMWMDLAVVWIDATHQVVDVQLARAWRPAYWPRRPARYVLETGIEYLNQFAIGDQIEFEAL